jgi:predicted transcriptional regulator
LQAENLYRFKQFERRAAYVFGRTQFAPTVKDLNNTEQIIVKYIYDNAPTHIDEIIRGSGLDVTAVNSGVMMLQMKGIINEGRILN